MFLSMNWISDFVDLSGLDKMELIRKFSLSTAEVENEIFFKGSDFSGIVVAEIKSVEDHPESKKLHLLKVDAGDGKLTDVVCGAPNVRVGMKTAFAKVGAKIGDITIAPRPLAGFDSFGMCCSEKEIGISDDNSGGVFSSVDLIAFIIASNGSFKASLTSSDVITIVLGRPVIRSLPFTSIVCSSNTG